LRHLVRQCTEVGARRLAGQVHVDLAERLERVVFEFCLLEGEAARDDEVRKVDELVFLGEVLLELFEQLAGDLLLVVLLDLARGAHLVGLLAVVVGDQL